MNSNCRPVAADSLRQSWLADLKAGAGSAMVALPVAIGGGILAVVPFGAGFASLGVKAGLVCAIVAAVVSAWLGSSRFSIGGPSATTSIVMASGLVHLVGTSPQATGDVFVVMASLVALSGVLLVLAGLLRFGSFIKFIPRPVLAGFSNGIALMLFISQLGAALGLPGRPILSWNLLHDVRVGALLVTAATAAVCLYAPRLKLWLPSQFAGLSFGIALHYLLLAGLGAAAVGPVVGELPSLWGIPEWIVGNECWSQLGNLPWGQILSAAFLLAIIGAVQTLMTGASVDAMAASRHDSNRELLGFGFGNIASALAGGIPSSANLGRASANFRAGARTRLSGLFNALVMSGLVLAASPLISAIPLAAMAGILIHSAIGMVDRWSLEQFRRWADRRKRGEVRENILVVVTMTVGMLWMNPLVAVIVGVVLTMGLFLKRMARTFVRRSYSCEAKRSLKVRPPELEQHLQAEGRKIHVIELEGAVFFGTADRLRHRVESRHRSALFVILDCRRVRSWDATGVQMIAQMHRELAREGRHLLISHVVGRRRIEPTLRAYGLLDAIPADRLFPDTDRALEYAEDWLLASISVHELEAMQRALLNDTLLLKGLSTSDQRVLSEYFDTFEMSAGEELFRAGDPGDSLFVMLEGEVTLSIPIDGHAALRRLQTISPGIVFGEMALLDAQPRSASARVDRNAVIKALSRRNFERLRQEHPRLFAQILSNIAHEMSLRLRLANQRLRMLEG